MRTLLIVVGLGAALLLPASASDNRPTNPNVKRAQKHAKKVRPAKYKALKHNKKPKRAVFGAH